VGVLGLYAELNAANGVVLLYLLYTNRAARESGQIWGAPASSSTRRCFLLAAGRGRVAVAVAVRRATHAFLSSNLCGVSE